MDKLFWGIYFFQIAISAISLIWRKTLTDYYYSLPSSSITKFICRFYSIGLENNAIFNDIFDYDYIDDGLFFFSFFPGFGFMIVIPFLIYMKQCNYKKLKLEIKHNNILNINFEKIPDNIQNLLSSIEGKILYLKELNYHQMIAIDSYNLLLQLLGNSFIDGNISVKSLKKVEDSCVELLSFLNNLKKQYKKTISDNMENHQESIDVGFNNYLSVLKSMSKDLENRRGVF